MRQRRLLIAMVRIRDVEMGRRALRRGDEDGSAADLVIEPLSPLIPSVAVRR